MNDEKSKRVRGKGSGKEAQRSGSYLETVLQLVPRNESGLKKVVWPKRKELVRACLVVAACILVIGVFIWIVDGVAAAVIRALINLFKG